MYLNKSKKKNHKKSKQIISVKTKCTRVLVILAILFVCFFVYFIKNTVLIIIRGDDDITNYFEVVLTVINIPIISIITIVILHYKILSSSIFWIYNDSIWLSFESYLYINFTRFSKHFNSYTHIVNCYLFNWLFCGSSLKNISWMLNI